MTEKTKSKRSIAATQEGILKLKAAQKKQDGQYLSYLKIADTSGVDASTVSRFFRGIAIDIPYAEWITQSLGLTLRDVVNINELILG